MNGNHTPCSTKAIVGTPIIDGSDVQLTQSRRAHDAWFDCYVKIRLFKDRRGVMLEDGIDGHELCMSCSLLINQKHL